MHITDSLLWRYKFTPYSSERGNATNTENCHNATNLCMIFTANLSFQGEKLKKLL